MSASIVSLLKKEKEQLRSGENPNPVPINLPQNPSQNLSNNLKLSGSNNQAANSLYVAGNPNFTRNNSRVPGPNSCIATDVSCACLIPIIPRFGS